MHFYNTSINIVIKESLMNKVKTLSRHFNLSDSAMIRNLIINDIQKRGGEIKKEKKIFDSFLNIGLPEKLYDDIIRLANEKNVSFSQLVRIVLFHEDDFHKSDL